MVEFRGVGRCAHLSGAAAWAGWEVDLWGAIRAGAKASEAAYRSTEADYVYARASLGAATARAWLLNMQAARQLELMRMIDAASQTQLAIVTTRAELGKATGADQAQAGARADAAHEQWLQAAQAREAAQRSLELLLGRYPAAKIEVGRDAGGASASNLHTAQLPAVPAGVPLDVLERRPDLIAARNAFDAAFFGAQQAKAARLPNLTLTAGAGYFDSGAMRLQGALDGLVFPVGAKLSWPVFDGGRRQTQFEIATVRQSEAAAQYARAIQRALGEVENGLAAERQLGLRAATLHSQQAQTAYAAELAQVQQEVGSGRPLRRARYTDRRIAYADCILAARYRAPDGPGRSSSCARRHVLRRGCGAPGAAAGRRDALGRHAATARDAAVRNVLRRGERVKAAVECRDAPGRRAAKGRSPARIGASLLAARA
ncbi:MAG: TolC family protein [Pararobbsia sp.]